MTDISPLPQLTHTQRQSMNAFRRSMHSEIEGLGGLLRTIARDFCEEAQLVMSDEQPQIINSVLARMVQEGRDQWQDIQKKARVFFADEPETLRLTLDYLKHEAYRLSSMNAGLARNGRRSTASLVTR